MKYIEFEIPDWVDRLSKSDDGYIIMGSYDKKVKTDIRVGVPTLLRCKHTTYTIECDCQIYEWFGETPYFDEQDGKFYPTNDNMDFDYLFELPLCIEDY